MAPHSSTLAWKIPWMEEPGGLQSMGSLESDMTERLHFHFSLSCIGGGNDNPLQCSCLENPRDRGAWWAAVYGVTQSWTRLKWLSSSSSSNTGRTDAEAETPYCGHLMWRTDSLEKTLMLGKIEGRGEGDDRGWDGWMASLTQWTWVRASSGSWWWTGRPGVQQSMGLQRVWHIWATELNFRSIC